MDETIDPWLIEDHKNYGDRLARALNRFEGLFCSRRFTACEDAFAAAGGPPINPTIARRVLALFSQVGATAPRKDYGLTTREREILQLLVQGHGTKEAAARLQISYHTADGYIREVDEKLQFHTRSGVVAKAIKEVLTS